ncbi:3'-5' exonuclease [Bacteroidota bacterium]
MFLKEIDKEAINKLEVRHFAGDIRLIEDAVSCRSAMEEIQRYSALGFDTETKPAFKKGKQNIIALIQISNHTTAWLFRTNLIGIPPELKAILENDRILKIGAGLHDDMRGMRKLANFAPGGFLDLQKYVEAFNIESKSLKKIAAIVLGYKISKSQQMSNWEAESLTLQQQQYAATDAWVCLEIYNKLRTTLKDLNEQSS